MHEIPPEEFQPRPHAEPRRAAGARRHARLHEPGRVRGGRLLARASDRSARPRRRDRGRLRTPAPARGRDAARALLPRLPLRAGRHASSDSRARAELTFEATLFSNVNSAMPRALWEAFPFADDIVMSEDQEWSRRVLRAGLRHRLRARGCRPPLARLLGRGRHAAILRLRRLGRALVRRRHASRGPRCGKAGMRYAQGELALAVDDRTAALDPVYGGLRAREVRRPPARTSTPPPPKGTQVTHERISRALARVAGSGEPVDRAAGAGRPRQPAGRELASSGAPQRGPQATSPGLPSASSRYPS